MDQLMTLNEAAASLHSRITARSLRTEIAKGRLHAVHIAGKQFVRKEDLEDFLCRARIPAHGSKSDSHPATDHLSTSSCGSKADANVSAQQALEAAKTLCESSKARTKGAVSACVHASSTRSTL
jgi:hypothetical protein